MNEVERDKLRVLLGDSTLLSALHKVFDEVIEDVKPTVDNEDNAVLGEKYRAYDTSQKILKRAFMKLEEYRDISKEQTGNIRHI